MTAMVCGAALLGACAHTPRHARPVSIDSRPTPRQPRPGVAAPAPSARATGDSLTAGITPARRLLAEVANDTLAVSSTLRRCAGRNLLPEQEATAEAAGRLLVGVRGALEVNDLEHAAELAREARQLSRSLNCGH